MIQGAFGFQMGLWVHLLLQILRPCRSKKSAVEATPNDSMLHRHAKAPSQNVLQATSKTRIPKRRSLCLSSMCLART